MAGSYYPYRPPPPHLHSYPLPPNYYYENCNLGMESVKEIEGLISSQASHLLALIWDRKCSSSHIRVHHYFALEDSVWEKIKRTTKQEGHVVPMQVWLCSECKMTDLCLPLGLIQVARFWQNRTCANLNI